jgi:hypothetical protein
MADLRSYMSSGFIDDSLIVNDLEEQMKEVVRTFDKCFDAKMKRWPYELRPSRNYPAGVPSQTTTSMILSSILGVREEWGKMPWKRAASGMVYFFDFPLPDSTAAELTTSFSEVRTFETVKTLIDIWASSNDYISRSTTFGRDDPMSLGWSLDLIRWVLFRGMVKRTDLEPTLRRIVRRCVQRAEKLIGAAGRKLAKESPHQSLCENLLTPSKGRKAGDSSYILARFTAVLRAIIQDRSLSTLLAASDRATLERSLEVLWERFETRLHDHLSFVEIVDSRFDPTELAFCLEGMLLIRFDYIGRTVFDRVMTVLRTVQDKGASWRSETPMLYRDNGDVLFTVSVEAVNAMLASFALFDGQWSQYDAVASDYIALIKRYWRWLKARKAVVRIGEDNLEGWHSEHVNDPNLVHLWETSQVAEFLVNFRDQLKRHAARTSLKLAACSFKLPAKPEPIRLTTAATPIQRWEAACESLEPVACLGARFEVYKLIEIQFIKPRFEPDGKPAYSMLLYGPPGTGKTTVAACLSWALDYPLITITVSDFLADGHAAIEARAKDLFDMLRAQPRTVVLFDEIDQFMLDRDSEYFRDQETVFQFLTPGMLTKLNDLRASKSVLFVMATNYAERIDAAIKRQGRIDQHLLLLPPDKERRKKHVADLWKPGTIDMDEAAAKSVFLSYNDMKLINNKGLSGPDAIRELVATVRAATPDAYIPRFQKKNGEPITEVRRAPITEFIAMVALEVDAIGQARATAQWEDDIKLKAVNRFEKKPPGKIQDEFTTVIVGTR